MWRSRVLCLDPGGTTGVALIEYNEETAPEVIFTKQIGNGLQGFLNWHWDELEDIDFDTIVCESFTLREGVYGVDLSPVYVIGALEALYPVHDKIYQAPSTKPLCSNERLKDMGLYEPGRDHAMDALRHGLIYLRNKKHKPTLELGWK